MVLSKPKNLDECIVKDYGLFKTASLGYYQNYIGILTYWIEL